MSLSTQTLKRLPKIKRGVILGLNRDQIGATCQVTEKTIDRDFIAWVDSGLFEVWIKEEFVRLHPQVCKKDLVEAYRNITKLVGKMITRRIEAKTEYTEKVLHVIVSSRLMKDESTTRKTTDQLRAT